MQFKIHLKERGFQRYCLLLVIMVLGQHFNVVLANQVAGMEGVLKRATADGRLDDDWETPEETGPLHKYEKRNQKKDEHQKSLMKKGAKEMSEQRKRGIHGALFAASVATSLLNIALDVAIKFGFCCVLYKELCRDTKKYRKKSKKLSKKMVAVNKQWKEVQLLRDWIKSSNDKNAEIWIEVKRIGDLQDRIVKVLDPTIIKAFNIKVDGIRKEVQAKNQTVIGLSYKEFDNLFQSAFTTVEDTALRLAPITGLLGTKIAAFGFKHYKLAKITKTLRTSYGSKLLKAGPGAKKFFGYSKAGMKMHLKQTSKSMYKAAFSGSRAARFMKGAGSVMSVVSIAMDVYSIIKKIKKCKKMRDNARKSLRKLEKAEREVHTLSGQLDTYERTLNKRGVQFIKKQLVSQDLHTILASIRDLSLGASKQSGDLRSAAPAISTFLTRIKQASNAETSTLQTQLISALKKVTIFLECYLNKLKMAKYVQKYCMRGSDSIDNLYHRAIRYFDPNSASCRTKNGFPYTTLSTVKSLITSQAKKKGFLTDCVLNSKPKKERACALKSYGSTAKEIASKMKLQEYQVKHFLKTCPETPITPAKISQICLYRQFCAPESKIASMTKISEARLLKVPCACSELSL